MAVILDKAQFPFLAVHTMYVMHSMQVFTQRLQRTQCT